jgi:hypothetical protein
MQSGSKEDRDLRPSLGSIRESVAPIRQDVQRFEQAPWRHHTEKLSSGIRRTVYQRSSRATVAFANRVCGNRRATRHTPQENLRSLVTGTIQKATGPLLEARTQDQ